MLWSSTSGGAGGAVGRNTYNLPRFSQAWVGFHQAGCRCCGRPVQATPHGRTGAQRGSNAGQTRDGRSPALGLRLLPRRNGATIG